MRDGWAWLLLIGSAVALIGGGAYMAVTNRKTGPRWNRMLPEARAKAAQLEQLAAARGLPVMFWDGWRDPAETLKNIAAGTSKVTDALGSLHTWGVAFDLVFRNAAGLPTWLEDPSKPKDWVDPRWRQLAELGRSIGLYSGGLNWGWDWPHFQIPGYTASALKQQWGGNYLAFLQSRGAVLA